MKSPEIVAPCPDNGQYSASGAADPHDLLLATGEQLYAEFARRVRKIDPHLAARLSEAETFAEWSDLADVARAALRGLWAPGQVDQLLSVGTSAEVAEEARRRMAAPAQLDPSRCPTWCLGDHLRTAVDPNGFAHDSEGVGVIMEAEEPAESLTVKPAQYVTADGSDLPTVIELQDDRTLLALLSTAEAEALAAALTDAIEAVARG